MAGPNVRVGSSSPYYSLGIDEVRHPGLDETHYPPPNLIQGTEFPGRVAQNWILRSTMDVSRQQDVVR